MLLERANADILLAQYAISPAGNPSTDEYMIDMAAYHVQQAIEKTLKYVLQTKAGIDEETKGYKTHDIAFLITWVEEKTDLSIPEELKNMDDAITEWESASRYGGSYTTTVCVLKRLFNYILNFARQSQNMKQILRIFKVRMYWQTYRF